MDTLDYLFILIAYTIAGIIKGITGLGFSTSCLPIMALQLDLTLAIPLVIVPSVVSNVVIMVQAGKFIEVLRRFWLIYVASVPGLWIGLNILISINVNVAKIILGFVLILYALFTLSRKPFSLSPGWERNLKLPVGFLTGFINGLTGSQVMPILPYLLSANLSKSTFIQAINISFTLSSLIMLLGLQELGHLSPHTLIIAVFGIIPVVTIVYLCGRVRNRVSDMLYRRLVLFFLLILGGILVIKSLV